MEKNMVKTETKRFIPISELIQSPHTKLTSNQREVIQLHEEARTAMANFIKSKQRRVVGVFSSEKIQTPSKEEIKASGYAMVALKVAMEYYHKHDNLTKAFTEVREIAREHWHPVIDEMWSYHFQKRAEDADITLPRNLSRQIGDAREEIINRMVDDSELIRKSERNKGKPN